MLTITITSVDAFDEASSSFIELPEVTLHLEHSLVSLSKWESKWEKPFLNTTEKTSEETLDYIRLMALDENLPDDTVERLSEANLETINAYIQAPMTATWFPEEKKGPGNLSGEAVTAELIYYWMIALTIPPEYETWHLNRLFTLIKVCNKKNEPKKKMSKGELQARNRSLNASRKAALNTNG